MGYTLGVDLGTTFTAAAVDVGGRVEAVSLGSRRSEIPSLVFVREDGEIFVGEAAERRGGSEPGRLAREFKRRVGDPVPILVGGSPYSAHALMAHLLHHVVAAVSGRHERAPTAITVTHPANWGPYKRELLAQAVRLADLDHVGLRTEPEAAVVQYAADERVPPNEIVAVYDLGGGTFDAAVLRKTAVGFDLLGEPEGIEQLGGIDFDEAVFGHVLATLGDAAEGLDTDDEETTAAVARLRRDCIDAKEALSFDTDVTIPVALPGLHTRVRLNRSEFEAMVGPTLRDTVTALRRALRSAGVEPADLRSIVLAGGSARIPLVSQLLSTGFGRPVVTARDPEHAIALGAALLTRPTATARPPMAPGPAHIVPGPVGRVSATSTPLRTPEPAPPARLAPPAAARVPGHDRSPRRPPGSALPTAGGTATPATPVPPARRPDDPATTRMFAATPAAANPAAANPATANPATAANRATANPATANPANASPAAANPAAANPAAANPAAAPGPPGPRRRANRRAMLIGGLAAAVLIGIGGVAASVDFGNAATPPAAPGASSATATPTPAPALPADPILVQVDQGGGGSQIARTVPGSGRFEPVVTKGATGREIRPVWSHDRRKVAFTRSAGSRWEAWVMDLDAGRLRILTRKLSAPTRVSWSPDDRRIAFVSGAGDEAQLFTKGLGETAWTQLTTVRAAKDGPAWAPDGERIAFSSARDGPAQLYATRADRADPTWQRLTFDDTSAATDPAWSPDGTQVAYTRTDVSGDSDIWVVGANGTGAHAVTSGPDADAGPTWSPDGSWVAFTRGPSGSSAVHAVRADGTDLRRITDTDKQAGSPSWS